MPTSSLKLNIQHKADTINSFKSYLNGTVTRQIIFILNIIQCLVVRCLLNKIMYVIKHMKPTFAAALLDYRKVNVALQHVKVAHPWSINSSLVVFVTQGQWVSFTVPVHMDQCYQFGISVSRPWLYPYDKIQNEACHRINRFMLVTSILCKCIFICKMYFLMPHHRTPDVAS